VCHGRLQRTQEEIAQHIEDCVRKVRYFLYFLKKFNKFLNFENLTAKHSPPSANAYGGGRDRRRGELR
jgi:hypothetical protein